MAEIARGDIVIDLQDREAMAALHRLDREFDETMAKIDREKATATIDADARPLKREAAEAKKELDGLARKKIEVTARLSGITDDIQLARRQLKELDGLRADPEVTIDMDAFDRKEAILKARIKKLEGEKASIEIDVDSDTATLAATEAYLKAIKKNAEDLERVESAADKRRVQAMRQESRVRESLERQRVRELTQAEREARAIEAERNEVPKLDSAYVRLGQRLERLQEVRRRANGDDRATFMVDLDESNVLREMEHVRNLVRERAGRDPIELPARPTLGKDAGEKLRLAFYRNGSLLGVASDFGSQMGEKMGTGLSRRFKSVTERGVRNSAKDLAASIGGSIGGAAIGGVSKIGRGLDSLADASVRLGPFTTSIRGAIVGLSLLGPSIIDVVGAAGSLISVVGSATLGVGALGATLVSGAIPGLIGLVTALHPVAAQFQDTMKASKAYNDAVRQYGTNSDQAQKKLKVFNHVLGDVDDQTRKNFLAAGTLSQRWQELTKPTQAQGFKTIGTALGFANQNLGGFAGKTNALAKQVGPALRTVIRGLDMSAIGESMDNVSRAIGPVIRGMGNLANYVLRVGAAASRSLPGLANTFENWSKKVFRTTEASDFQSKINGVINSAKGLGRFFLAAGRLMGTFFSGGVKAGNGFVQTMTNALNRWDRFLSTTQGQKSLSDFFSQSVKGAQALYGVLAPIGTSFVGWAESLAPIVSGFLQGAGAVSSFVASVLKLTGLSSGLTAVATTLGALWAVGKARSAAAAIGSFTSALLGLSRAQAEVKATSAAGSVAQAATGAAAVRGAETVAATRPMVMPTTFPAQATGAIAKGGAEAEQAAAKVTKMARAGRVAEGALSGLGAVTVGVSSATAGLGVIALGAGVAWYLYSKRTRDWQKSAKVATQAAQQGRTILQGLGDASTQLAQSTLTASQSEMDFTSVRKQSNAEERQLITLRKQGKQGTQAYRDAEEQHKNTILQVQQARLNEVSAMQTQQTQVAQLRKGVNASVESYRQAYLAQQKSTAQLKDTGPTERAYKLAVDGAHAAGQSLKDYLKEQKNFNGLAAGNPLTSKSTRDQVLKYADSLDKSKASLQSYQRAVAQAQLGTMNISRAMKGLAPIAQQAAGAFQKVQQLGGKNLASKISLKFEDPGQAAKVAASTAKTLAAGVPKTLVMRIVADSKNAEQAIKSLQAVRIPPKKLEIVAGGGNNAVKTIEAIAGKKLSGKQLSIAIKGGDAALNLLGQIVAKKLPTKTQQILERGGDKAVSMLEQIAGRKLTQKEQHIVEQGGSKVLGVLGNIIGKNFHNKTQSINEKGSGGVIGVIQRIIGMSIPNKSTTITAQNRASGVISSVIGALASIPRSVTSVITTIAHKITRGKADGGQVDNFAGGGDTFEANRKQTGALPNQAKVDRAAKTADLSGSIPTTGGKYNKPRYLVGEEGSSEFVIATNPKYRKRNVGYLRDAAAALGVGDLRDAAQQQADSLNKKVRGGITAAAGGFRPYGGAVSSQGGYVPSRDLGSAPTVAPKAPSKVKGNISKFTAARKVASQSGRDYVSYIASLQTAQDDWQQTVQQRQSQVQEPSTFLKEDGRIMGKEMHTNAVTGQVTEREVDLGPKMVVDQGAIDSYKGQLAYVQDAIAQLILVIQTIIAEIPKALKSLDIESEYDTREIAARQSNVTHLNNEIDREKTIIANNSRGKQTDAKQRTVARHRGLLKDDQDALTSEKRNLDSATEDRKRLAEDRTTLTGAFRDAGFALNDAQTSSSENMANFNGVQGKASTDASDQNTSTSASDPSKDRDYGENLTAAIKGQPAEFGGTSDSSTTSASGGSSDTPLTYGQQVNAFEGAAATIAKQFGSNFTPAGGGTGLGTISVGGAARSGGSKAASMLGSASGASSTITGGAAAYKALSAQPQQGSSMRGAMGSAAAQLGSSTGDNSTTVNVTNNFPTPPADPHTFSKGLQFELGALG